jgi:hypothetical protein
MNATSIKALKTGRKRRFVILSLIEVSSYQDPSGKQSKTGADARFLTNTFAFA